MAKKNLNAKALIALSTVALVAALAQQAARRPQCRRDRHGRYGCCHRADRGRPDDPTGPYVSDEACLACHGGSFEANAANTEKYGQWNPHSSIHGGYNSCDNCHEKGQEVTRNWCANCHTYSAEGSDYHEDSLFL